MLRKIFQNFTVNSSWHLGVEFDYIQKLHWPVITLLKWHYLCLPSACEKKPDLHVLWAALQSLGLNLVLDPESHIFLESEALAANCRCWSVIPKGDKQLAAVPGVNEFVKFTSRSEAEDQDYRAIWELIFSIPSKWNNRMHNGWSHWQNVLLKHFSKDFT